MNVFAQDQIGTAKELYLGMCRSLLLLIRHAWTCIYEQGRPYCIRLQHKRWIYNIPSFFEYSNRLPVFQYFCMFCRHADSMLYIIHIFVDVGNFFFLKQTEKLKEAQGIRIAGAISIISTCITKQTTPGLDFSKQTK